MAKPTEAGWGASLCFVADFGGRVPLVSSCRQLMADLCASYLEPTDRSAALVMAVQELLENLAKYSLDDSASFELALRLVDGQPQVRIRTRNRASGEHLKQASQLLERIANCSEPVALYDEWVAASGERDGSQLGLIRLRAEAGLALSHTVEAEQLCIEAVGSVDRKRSVS